MPKILSFLLERVAESALFLMARGVQKSIEQLICLNAGYYSAFAVLLIMFYIKNKPNFISYVIMLLSEDKYTNSYNLVRLVLISR